jgi:branched-chain amino acid transport system substrate-binding protein
MKSSSAIGVCSRLAALVLYIVFPYMMEASALPLKVGAILPLTGRGADLGGAIRAGMQMALENLPPQTREQLQVIYEDDANLPRNSVSTFSKLVLSDKVDVLVSVSAQPSMAVAPLADQYQRPLIAIAVPPKIVAGRSYAVLFYSTVERLGGGALDEALRRGYRKIARISAIHDGRAAQKQEFDRANQSRIEIVLDEEYPLEEKDFRTFLAKLKSLPALDAICVNLYFGQIGIFARQARELGVPYPLFSTDVFSEDPQEMKSSNGALLGQWYVTQTDPEPAFMAKFERLYPGQNQSEAGNGHDVIQVLAKAVEQHITGPRELNVFLHQLHNFSGALGRYSATGDNRFDIPVTVKVLTADGPKIVKAGP